MLDADLDVSGEDALAQPSRAHLFGLLAELKRAAKTTELAARLDMHPNGVRIHLERLEQAGLVAGLACRGRRGRPADAWTIAPDARPGRSAAAGVSGSGTVAGAVDSTSNRNPTSGPLSARAVRSARARSRRRRSRAGGGRALAGCAGSLRTYSRGRVTALTVCLGNCPYRDVVREDQAAICALHKGITVGPLDVLAPGTEVERFVPDDPAQAGCVVELTQRCGGRLSGPEPQRRAFAQSDCVKSLRHRQADPSPRR